MHSTMKLGHILANSFKKLRNNSVVEATPFAHETFSYTIRKREMTLLISGKKIAEQFRCRSGAIPA